MWGQVIAAKKHFFDSDAGPGYFPATLHCVVNDGASLADHCCQNGKVVQPFFFDQTMGFEITWGLLVAMYDHCIVRKKATDPWLTTLKIVADLSAFKRLAPRPVEHEIANRTRRKSGG